jgi:hypothetical protein
MESDVGPANEAITTLNDFGGGLSPAKSFRSTQRDKRGGRNAGSLHDEPAQRFFHFARPFWEEKSSLYVAE